MEIKSNEASYNAALPVARSKHAPTLEILIGSRASIYVARWRNVGGRESRRSPAHLCQPIQLENDRGGRKRNPPRGRPRFFREIFAESQTRRWQTPQWQSPISMREINAWRNRREEGGEKKNARRGSGELIKRIAAVIQCLCAVTFMARLNRDGMESFRGGRICGCAISGCVRISKKKKKKRVVRFEGNKTRYRRLIKRRRKQSSRSLASSVKLDTCQRVTFPKGYTFSYLNQKRDT